MLRRNQNCLPTEADHVVNGRPRFDYHVFLVAPCYRRRFSLLYALGKNGANEHNTVRARRCTACPRRHVSSTCSKASRKGIELLIPCELSPVGNASNAAIDASIVRDV